MPRLIASSGENSPIADDYQTVADQTQLDAVEGVSLASEELKLGDHLPGEEATAVTPALEPKIDLVPEREEPEGTEPPRVAPEQSSELPSVWREESSRTSPPALRDGGGPPAPRPAGDSALLEGTDSFVVKTIKNVHIAEEDHFIEGNICAFVHSGDQMLSPETCQGVLLSLMRVTREVLEPEFWPRGLSNAENIRMWLGKPQAHKCKL